MWLRVLLRVRRTLPTRPHRVVVLLRTVTIYAMPTITSGGVSGPQEVCVGSTIDFDGSGTAASEQPMDEQ